MWVARDASGSIFCFMVCKPTKDLLWKMWSNDNLDDDAFLLSPELFPEVKWEDDEPRKVKLVLED